MKMYLSFTSRLLAFLSVIALTVFPLACAAPSPTPATTRPPAVTSPVVPPVTKPVVTTPVASPPAATTPVANMPTIRIESPRPFQLTQTGNVTMNVQVTNFNLVDKIDQPSVAGEGHIDWYMDIDLPLTVSEAVVPKFGAHFASPATTHAWANVPIGSRLFTVQLVNNDHTPLNPPVIDTITLNVVPPATGPAIYGAVSGGYDPEDNNPSDFYYDPIKKEAVVAVATRNFDIVDTSSQATPQNVPGQGHFIFYMDIDPAVVGRVQTTTGNAAVWYKHTYNWKNVEPGLHAFSVQLVNHDDTPLNPPMVYKMLVDCVALPPPLTGTPAATASPALPTLTITPTRLPSTLLPQSGLTGTPTPTATPSPK